MKQKTALAPAKESFSFTNIIEKTANPAPLGLMAFGMTTVLLNLHNAGYFALDSMVIAMGLFYGGIAQVIAGFMEWKKSNTFGETAFLSYGFFWLSLVGILIFPKMGLGLAPDSVSMGFYLLMWGIFTAGLFLATLRITRSLQIVFFTLTLLFFMLSFADFTGNTMLKTFAGYEGIFCGLCAMYTSLAQVLNEIYEKKILPL
ncbi:MAG TPA: acetate uptake transporter [Candidatus Nanoarchaeia archaeon]|nr:acetate uptake transporter [Candidatus Nanoarchaeia archaeon]